MLVGYNLEVWQRRWGGLEGRRVGVQRLTLVTIRFLAFHSSKMLTPFNTVTSPPKYKDAICSSLEAW